MSQQLREIEFVVNLSMDDAWMKTFDFWKNQKVRTKPPAMENLADGSRRMMIEQLMSFSSNGQTYQLVFKGGPVETTVHVWVGLTFGWGMQWQKPLSVIRDLARFLGAQYKGLNYIN